MNNKLVSLLAVAILATGCGTRLPAESATNLHIRSYSPLLNKDIKVNVALHMPAKQLASKPAVVMMSGCDGMFSDSAIALRNSLNAEGVLVAELQTIQAHGNACAKSTVTGPTRAKEAFATRDELVRRGLAAEANVGLVGWSHGGWAITNAVFKDNITDNRVPFASAVAFYPGCASMETRTHRLITPTLILIGSADDWTPSKSCEHLTELTLRESGADAAIKIFTYRGATHAFDFNAPTRTMLTKTGAYATLSFDQNATADAYARAIAMFKQTLRF